MSEKTITNIISTCISEDMKKKEMPSPTTETQNSDVFNAIWDIMKTWDINVPEYYNGYCGANGSHVQLIIDELNKRNCINYRREKLERILNDK